MKRLVALLFFACSLTGCSSQYRHPVPDACYFNSEIEPLDQPVDVVLVLGGGGARGIAHIGVLYEFEEAGIPIDCIVGCSVGGIVGALYCSNPDACWVARTLGPIKRCDLIDISCYSRYGLATGHRLRKFLRKHLHCRHFHQLQIPLIIVATDLAAGEIVTINKGLIIPAVHASSAFPLVFEPVVHRGHTLVDGGVIEPVPVNTAKQVNPTIIIAVDVGEPLPHGLPTNMFGVVRRSIEITYAKQSHDSVRSADIVIRPEMRGLGVFSDGLNHISFQAGREAAREAIPHIQELLASIDH